MRTIRIGHSAQLLSQGEFRITEILSVIRRMPSLTRRGPRQPKTWSVQVSIVNQPTMRHLNAKHRGKDSVTDILSFEAPEVFRNQGVLGDLVVCLPVLKRQAVAQKTGISGELDVLLVHGVLHLLGLEHETSEAPTPQELREARVMASWEGKILKALPRRKKSLGLIARAHSGRSKK